MWFCSFGEFLRVGMFYFKVVVLERRFMDINFVDVLYKKKRGFLFGWGGVLNDILLMFVIIEEIWVNNKLVFLFFIVFLLYLFFKMG